MSWEEFGNQESEGGIKDFEMTVTNAFFAVDEAYSAAVGSDVFFLHWEGTTDVLGHEQMTRDGFHPKWALDADWISMDGGNTVKSQSGKGKLGKAAGRLCGAAFNSVQAAGIKAGDPSSPFESGTPREASVWIGSKWFIEEVEREWGNGMVSRDLLPTKYLGKGDVVAAVAAAPVAAAPVAAAPAPVATPGLRESVTALAGSIGDHATFVTAAMAIPGVAGDAALVSEIVAPTGLWATAQG